MSLKPGKDIEEVLGKIIRKKVRDSLDASGLLKEEVKVDKNQPKAVLSEKPNIKKPELKEALVVTPVGFVVKTEKLSKRTIEAHEGLYRKYVDTFNKVSSELDSANKYDANSFGSLYRAFKLDECNSLNSIKLHELYFANISDLASEIGLDSLPYIRFARDFGTFENWQFDFMACAMSSREGWAMTVYEPYKNSFMNICVDGHANGIPVGAIPVVVIDMWSHSFYKDYDIDKKSYLVAMMRELNWDVIEARMALADKAELAALYRIRPVYNDMPEKMLNQATAVPSTVPIEHVSNAQPSASVPPTTPPAPERVITQDRNARGY